MNTLTKVTWGDVVSVLGLMLVALLVLGAVLSSCGCVSAPPGARAGWSVSLVSIQLGGTSSQVDVQNYMSGTNTQTHSGRLSANPSDPVTLSLPVTP